MECTELQHCFTEGHLVMDGPPKKCVCGQMEVRLTQRGLETRTPDLTGLIPLDDALTAKAT